ncbi:hypothetical protein [Sorangium cellulosum]|uniref:hypothetical protein n=1 Tax=Sorangium cellulosum TaxID=56 RepID=UPI001331466A|nr:hypothetical protein [Sorangium cellulosum]
MKLVVVQALVLAVPMLCMVREAHAHSVAMSDLPEGCLSQLNSGSLPIHNDFGTLSSFDSTFMVSGQNESACAGYTWIKFFNTSNDKVMRPQYGLNVNSSAWDCNHTALTWGLYMRVMASWGQVTPWTFVNGGNMFGSLVSGTCTYDPENIPHGAGGTSSNVISSSVFGTWIEYRLAVKAWQHDDVAFGHPGTWCGGLPQCNHNVLVKFDAP